MTRISAAAATLLLLSTTGCVGAPPMASAPSSGPAMAAYFDCVRDGGVAISAHRAVSALDQPENSIAAIETTGRAIPNAILELDAVLTKDRHLVLMHDDTMDRTTTGRGRIADLTLAQVKQARLKASNGALTRAAPPTLGEALDAAGRVGAIASIDLKPADGETTVDLARAVIDQVRRSRAGNRVILITYNDADARAVAAMAPEMMISAGLSGVDDLSGLNPAQILAWTGTREERPALWRALREAGVEVQFGTLGAEGVRRDDRYAADGDVSEYRDLVRQGVTVIATDTPLAAKSVLGAEVAKAATCARPR
ncbi:glycerophosphodiester phosphodiesterase family protein [Brevundimonas sp. BT-123]|uniref:glycerophosphodiester phosphodiesterase family protein n=1 Tax=Brevundimonas sp. BT-123 TaxID=2986928 RepID=UPI002236A1B1|nr:glycerophosphodiester phosphodiesterase family protein [Brevundimonas sp. BT-123]MCW0045307.1 glycerophosphodiester phosphodiesterase family protein [Brevundimonas sp. BT-123]